MTQLVPVTSDMFSDIYDALLRHHDDSITREKWEALVNHGIGDADAERGYALVDSGNIVGFHGVIITERPIQKTTFRFCNLHTWIVKESHRGYSLNLLRPILRLKDHTITDMTPSRGVHQLLRRLGFAELDSRLQFLLPTRCSDRASSGPVDAISDTGEASQCLNAAERKLLSDHADTECRHVVFSDGKQYCLIFYTHVQRHWVSYCYIHHCSKPKFFERHQGKIRAWLMKESYSWFVAIDSRLTRGLTLTSTRSFPVKMRKLFKSDDVAFHQIDNMYTELSVNGLSALPDFSSAVNKRFLAALHKFRRIPVKS